MLIGVVLIIWCTGVLKQRYPNVPIMALTATGARPQIALHSTVWLLTYFCSFCLATATATVKKDVLHELAMSSNHAEFQRSFNRPNLVYEGFVHWRV
jgi:superfamily II DNA helicase RecQ